MLPLLFAPLAAQETEAPDVVQPGFMQVETGASFEPGSVVAPAPLLRLGLTPRLELRAGSDGLERAGGRTSVMDPGIGAKLRLFDEARIRPAMSVAGGLSLPWGSPGVTSAGYDPSVTLGLAKTLPYGFETASNLIFGAVTDGGSRRFQHWQTLTVAHAVARDFSAYAEVYRAAPHDDGCHAWVTQAGITRPLGANRELEVSLGRTGSGRWFAGFKITLTLPAGPR